MTHLTMTRVEVSAARRTGLFGLLTALPSLATIPLYFMYSGAPPDWNILTRTLLTLIGLMAAVGFFAGLREIIGPAKAPYEWAASLGFAAGLLYVGVILVAQSMEAGAVIATTASIDPTQDGPLAPGHFLLYGAIARLLTAVFAAAVAYAILRSHVLPAWTGRLAYALAGINLLFVPSIYFGAEADHFYSAVSWGTTAVAGSFLLYWIIAVSVVLLKGRTTRF